MGLGRRTARYKHKANWKFAIRKGEERRHSTEAKLMKHTCHRNMIL